MANLYHYDKIRDKRLEEEQAIQKATEEVLAICISHWKEVLFEHRDVEYNQKFVKIMNNFKQHFGNYNEKVVKKELIRRGIFPEHYYTNFWIVLVMFLLTSFISLIIAFFSQTTNTPVEIWVWGLIVCATISITIIVLLVANFG